MKTFIQATEIWAPSRDRNILEYHAGLFGPHHAFRTATQKMCFGYDEGLPGKAWASRRPIILNDLQSPLFRRRDAARTAGLTCGVAIPVFAGDMLLAVLVFFCGDDNDHVGAIELWHNDPAQSADMGLEDGYFGIADGFKWVAQHTRFANGFGLPGTVWKSGMPEIMDDLGHANRFVRRDDARRIGVNKGLGIPSPYAGDQNYVIAFLSALGTPIARRFEIWVPDDKGAALRFETGQCDNTPDLASDYHGVVFERGGGVLGKVWHTGLPAIDEFIASEGSAVGASALKANLSSMVALPVLEDGRIKAVVAMYF
ncbi:GAF domain-containing protein [Uliginosibacterium sp. H3]|uniref:GAF domain-containing protein n=1 Tax=Uliginosibacterium silvisoli TaxID=3114758 RepID=A0ABU6KAF3_9RHOO|nr:GAF domain-containing protein [Uliginosibacterium sp. H3]